MPFYDLQSNSYFMRELRGLAATKGHLEINTWSDAELYRFMEVEKYIQEIYRRQASLLFDGETLYWNETGRSMTWRAWSGREGYWSPKFQRLAETGPIPAGLYEARQNGLHKWEETPSWNRALCVLRLVGKRAGKWPGCTAAWGTRRINLIPKPQTDTLGRREFTLHGGTTPGSAGCIDITGGIERFAEEFQDYGKDMLLEVNYKPLSYGAGYHGSRINFK